MRIVSVDNLKIFLEITGTNHDILLGMVIDYVSAQIQRYLNRTLTYASYSETYNSGRRYYYVKAIPIDTTKTITVTYDGTVQTVDDDYYVWGDSGLIEFDDETIHCDPKEIVIDYYGGYASSGSGTSEELDVAADIQWAAVLQCSYMYRRRKDVGITSMSLPDGSFAKVGSKGLLQEVIDILRPLRRRPTDT